MTLDCYGEVFNFGVDVVYFFKDYMEIFCDFCGMYFEVILFFLDKQFIDIGDYYGLYEKFYFVIYWKLRV